MKTQIFFSLLMAILCPISLYCQTPKQEPGPVLQLDPTIKPASTYTKAFNASYSDSKRLNWVDRTDFETYKRGFIAGPENPNIHEIGRKENIVWDFTNWDFLADPDAPPPSTVNPSLWRMEKLNAKAGLFRVTDSIYQIRSFDLAVMSFVIGGNGYIIIDPLGTPATAKAGHDLFKEYVINKFPTNDSRKKLKAVVFTHSHVDHFGGIYGIQPDNPKDPIPIYAPTNFLEEAVSENVYAGNVMGQRANYMYGNLLPKDTSSGIGAGLGLTTNSGSPTIKSPTYSIGDTTIHNLAGSGIEIEFLFAPNTEAPSEMVFYFPQFRALCSAEDATHTLHNLYSLRGAKTRSAREWVSTLTSVMQQWGESTDVIFSSHHWPVWGLDTVLQHLETQRAMYKFIHDQTLRLANMGYDMTTTAEIISNLPESLNSVWSSQGYYGTVNHNVKATWDLYLGWFDGNPAHLHKLPAISNAKVIGGKNVVTEGGSLKYVQYMGGRENILKMAYKDYLNGEYRWVAEVVQHLVNLDSADNQARYLLADALEQMGYQSVSGPWRDFYLSGALELREGRQETKNGSGHFSTLVFLNAMTSEQIFDWVSIMVDPQLAKGKTINFAIDVVDGKDTTSTAYQLKYACLNYLTDKSASLDFTIVIKKPELLKNISNVKNETELVQRLKDFTLDNSEKIISVFGANPNKCKELLGMLKPATGIFNLVTSNLPLPPPVNPVPVQQR